MATEHEYVLQHVLIFCSVSFIFTNKRMHIFKFVLFDVLQNTHPSLLLLQPTSK